MTQKEMGNKIRTFRMTNGLSIKEVSEKATLSTSYISQVERGQRNPSFASIRKIADALKIQVVDLFDEPPGNGMDDSGHKTQEKTLALVVKKNRRKKIVYPGSNVIHELITPDTKRAFLYVFFKVPPGIHSGDNHEEGFYIHEEGEECCLIMKGTLEVTVGNNVYVLNEGDSLYFQSKVPHRWQNIGDDDVEAFWIVCPPTF